MLALLIFLQLMPHIKPAKPFTKGVFGAHFVIGGDIGIMGNFRTRISRRADIGFNGVLYATPFVGIQGDINFLIHEKEPDIPFNISFYPLLNLGFGENLFYFSASGNFEIDFPVILEEENLEVIPYFLIGVGAEGINWESAGATHTDASLEAHGSFGMFFVITRKIVIPFEIHFSDEERGPTGFSFSIGILFKI